MGERLGDGVGAREGGEQGGMGVEDAVGEPADGRRCQDPHEAGEHQGGGAVVGGGGAHRLGEGGRSGWASQSTTSAGTPAAAARSSALTPARSEMTTTISAW